MKLFLYFLFSFIFSFCLLAQNKTIKGTIVDSEADFALNDVVVFVPNSSISTVSDLNGNFSLNIPSYIKEIAFEQLGYETLILPISEISAKIYLKPTQILDDVVAVSYDPKNWPVDLQYFKDLFLGKGKEVEKVVLKDPKKSLRFVLNNTEQNFKAYGKQTIIIENKYLGYQLNYNLLNFTSDFQSKIVNYQGFVLFKPLKGSKRQQKLWKLHRKQVYMGSMQHFAQSLFQNKLKEEGFQMNHLIRKRNPQYPSDSSIAQMKNDFKLGLISFSDPKFKTFSKKLLLPKYADYLMGEAHRDSILTGNNSKKMLQFKDYLYIQYKPNSSVYSSKTSLIFQTETPVYIFADGYIENDVYLMLEGDWALDKVAKMLPINYDPYE